MKKILVVNNLLGYYGAENVLKNMVNELSKDKEYKITLLTLLPSDRKEIVPRVIYQSVFSKGKTLIVKMVNKAKLMAGYRALAQLYGNGYDIAIAFKMGECSKFVGYTDAPVKLCWIHSNVSDLNEACSYSFKSLDKERKFLKERFKKLIAVSESCKESFCKKYGLEEMVDVIFNPVSSEDILCKSREELSDPKEVLLFEDNKNIPILGTVARLDEEQKQIGRLIHVSYRLKQEGYRHRLVVIGGGHDEPRYRDMISKLKLDHVYLLGFKDNPYKYMRRFSAFICSSRWESYSIVVNEALVLGTPVISTRCGGPEEVLEYGKYGVLTDNSEEGLYQAMLELLQYGPKDLEPYDAEKPMREFMTRLRTYIDGMMRT